MAVRALACARFVLPSTQVRGLRAAALDCAGGPRDAESGLMTLRTEADQLSGALIFVRPLTPSGLYCLPDRPFGIFHFHVRLYDEFEVCVWPAGGRYSRARQCPTAARKKGRIGHCLGSSS